jgi:hypothetical protein
MTAGALSAGAVGARAVARTKAAPIVAKIGLRLIFKNLPFAGWKFISRLNTGHSRLLLRARPNLKFDFA